MGQVIMKEQNTRRKSQVQLVGYTAIHHDIVSLLQTARKDTVRAVNALMTATYWEIGRRIVEFEQGGKQRAGYGEELLQRLAKDLTNQFGRGFSKRNLEQMRLFYLYWPIAQTVSAQSSRKQIPHAVSGKSSEHAITSRFPMPWSAYVRLLSVKDKHARAFYETEALRADWSVRQLSGHGPFPAGFHVSDYKTGV